MIAEKRCLYEIIINYFGEWALYRSQGNYGQEGKAQAGLVPLSNRSMGGEGNETVSRIYGTEIWQGLERQVLIRQPPSCIFVVTVNLTG